MSNSIAKLIPCVDCPANGSSCASCNDTKMLHQLSIKLEDNSNIIMPAALGKSEEEVQEDFDKQLAWLRNSLGLSN